MINVPGIIITNFEICRKVIITKKKPGTDTKIELQTNRIKKKT